MADPTSLVAPGVLRTDYWWGYWLASGLERNRKGQVVRSKHLEIDGREVRSTMKRKDFFTVRFDWSEAEQQARKQAEIDKLASPDALRALARRSAETGLAFFARAFNCCNNPDLPYQWPKGTRDEVLRLLAQLVHLAEAGPIRPRAGAQAQDDAAFQRFMAKVHSEA